MKNQILLTFLGVYLLSTGLSFTLFSRFIPYEAEVKLPEEVVVGEGEKLLLDVSGPKTEVCPITGKKYTTEEEKVWRERRPLTVMVENHEESRPQSGLSASDVVYEAVAEGGITRFLAIFYCEAVAKESILGPVRSARTYFLDWASEYGKYPLYVHVGGANTPGPANALGQIEDFGWGGPDGNDLNQFAIGFPTFWRDYQRLGHEVATEHTMYTTTEKLWAVAKKRGWTNLGPEGDDWQDSFENWLIEEKEPETMGNTEKIEFNFWEGYKDYEVRWQYDSERDEYQRFNGGKAHTDLNNKQQLTAKNIIIQFAQEFSANDGYQGNIHLLYKNEGTGKALIFKHGEGIEGTWQKDDRISRTRFFDKFGEEITLAAGRVWIEIVPIGMPVSY